MMYGLRVMSVALWQLFSKEPKFIFRINLSESNLEVDVRGAVRKYAVPGEKRCERETNP